MRRKKVEAWVVIDTQYGTIEAFEDEDTACAAMLSHMHATVYHLTEPDPLQRLKDAVMRTAVRFINDGEDAMNWVKFNIAVNALRKAKRGKP